MKIKLSPLDRLFSQYIRLRDNWTCRACGDTARKQECAHVFSRRYHAIRWNPDNAMCLCFTCHRWYTEHPHQWADFTKDMLGEQTLAYLWNLAQNCQAPRDPDKIIIGSDLIEKIKALGEKPVCGLGRKLSKVKK